jgi:hypothetical protein
VVSRARLWLLAASSRLAKLAAGGIKSFSEASKAKKKQNKAEREAAKAMEEARRRTEVNVMERLSIKKEPYEQQVMALLTQGALGLQAGVEGEQRGAAATAGRVQMAQNIGQERVRTAMGQELQDIERAKVDEEARLLDMRAGLNLAEAEGYQQMAADAEKARAANIEQGIAAFGNLATTSMENMPLYGFGDSGLRQGMQNRRLSKDARQIAKRSDNVGDVLGQLGQYGMPQQSQLGQPVLQQSQFTPPPTPDQFQQYLNTGGAAPDPYGGYGNFYNSFGRFIG